MGSPKDSYGKGYVDGLRRAERESKGSETPNDLVNGPFDYHPDGTTAYKEGYKDGKKDGKN